MSNDTDVPIGELSCQCPACSGQLRTDVSHTGAALSTGDLSDQISTGDSNVDAVIHTNGLKWGSSSFNSGATVSFSFLSSVPSYYSSLASKYGIDYPYGFNSFSTAQRNATREILDLYSDVANINFVETGGVGTITFANHSMPGGVGAYAYYPNLQRLFPSDTSPLSGDVWVNTSNTGTSKGSWGYLTLIHEIGHAIGLKHPGNYNAGGGGTDGPYLPGSLDSHKYTVMSYNDHPNYPNTSPVSPMLFDIAAVQYLYGKNMTTRTGNDTYTFSTNTELRTIWDAGGTDTIDASNDSNGATIRLGDGEFSSINGTNNIAIAYDATIENAIGSNASDVIYGNAVNNRLEGKNGNDRLYGGYGNDTLYGGAGNDTLSGDDGNDILDGGTGADRMTGGVGNDTYYVDNSSDVVIEFSSGGFDTVYTSLSYSLASTEIEKLVGTGSIGLNLTGSTKGNEIHGSSGGDIIAGDGGSDILLGNAGNDFLDAGDGNDYIDGGQGNDTIFGGAGIDNVLAGTGDDILDGGAGEEDLIIFSGLKSEYQFQRLSDGFEVTDLVVGRDGTDILRNFEFANFLDGQFNLYEPVLTLSKATISENLPAGSIVGSASVENQPLGEVFTYSLTLNPDGLFAIDPDTGDLSTLATLDHETLNVSSVRIQALGNAGTSVTSDFAIFILDANDAPIAEGGEAILAEDGSVVAAFDVTDQDGDNLQVSLIDGPAHGTVYIDNSGNTPFYSYVADDDFYGTDSFTYSVSDGKGGNDTAEMKFVVVPVNDAPVVGPDVLLTQTGHSITISVTDLMANDREVDGGSLSFTGFGSASNGTLIDNGDGTATFTPEDGFNGDAFFTYTIADETGLESTATVTVTVNDPPVANADAFTTDEDAVLQIAGADLVANDTDADGDPLTVTAVGGGVNGTVDLINGMVRFTPAEGFAGDASFTYTVSDGRGNLTTGTATVSVAAVDDVLWGDDGGDDALFGGAGSDSLYGQGGADVLRGGIGDDLLEGGDGDDIYTFDLGDGSDLIRDFDGETITETYTVNGGYWVSSGETSYWQPTTTTQTRTISTEIDAGHDAIAFGDGITADDIALSLDDAGNLTIALAGSAPALGAGLGDASDDQLVIENWIDTKDRVEELRFSDGTVIDISNLSAMIEGTAGADNLAGTADQDWIAAGAGDDTVDGDDGDDILSGGDGADTLTGGTGDDLLLGGDGEDVAVFSGDFADSNVTRQDGGTVIVTGPDGTDRLIGVEKLRFSDVEIFADGRNNAPIVADISADAAEDGAPVSIDVLTSAVDADGDTLTVTSAVLEEGAEGSVTINPDGTIGFDPGTGYQDLGTGETRSISIAYTVSDGQGGETPGTATVTVTGGNDGPVAVADSFTTDEDTGLVIRIADLIGNDTDADGDTLSITVIGAPTNGALISNVDGSFTFLPDQDFTGQTSFTYTISDGHGGTSTGTVTLTVNNVVDAAILSVADATGSEDGSVPLAIDAQAVSPSDGITAITIDGVPDWAGLNKGTENPDGSWSVTQADLAGLAVVPQGDASGSFDLTVSVTTSDGVDIQVISDTLSVTIAGIADMPSLSVNDAAGDEDTAIALDLSAALSDTDGSESLTISITGLPDGASLSAGTETDGVWTLTGADLVGLTLTPPENFNGDVALTITATAAETASGDTATSNAAITVSVNPVNDAPEAVDELSYRTIQGAAITLSAAEMLNGATDVDGDTLFIQSVGNAANGSVVLNPDGSVTFTPNAGYFGPASFEITITDGNGGTDTATIAIDSVANQAPVLVDDALTTVEDAVLVISSAALLANDSDPDGDTLTLAAVGNAVNGTVELNGTSIRFTPAAGFAGTASFTYTVVDGQGNVSSAMATVSVAAEDETIWGDDGGNDDLFGGAGADNLYGLGGNDILRGGVGDDLLEGGGGDDIYTFDLGDGSDRIRDFDGEVTTESYTVTGGYWVTTGETRYWQPTTTTHTRTVNTEVDAGHDAIAFGEGITAEDVALTMVGSDLIITLADAGASSAFATGTASPDQLTIENWADTKDRIEELRFADGSTVDISDLVFIEGTVNADSLTGTNAGDWISGGDGNDQIEGMDGNDVLSGGAGDDTINGGFGNDTLFGGDGDDHLTASAQFPDDSRNWLYGGAGDDTLRGHMTSDILDGGTGADTLIGDYGDDVYFIDNEGDTITEFFSPVYEPRHSGAAAPYRSGQIAGPNTSVVINVVPDPGRDTVFTSVSYDFTGTNIENIFALGTEGLTITGTYDANVIEGTIGNDTILAGDGNDILAGGKGTHDLLDGGTGDDVYLYSLGDGYDEFSDSGGLDAIQFGEGIAATDIQFKLMTVGSAQNLLLFFGSLDEEAGIDLGRWDNQDLRIETLKFDDGSMADISGIDTNALISGAPMALTDLATVTPANASSGVDSGTQLFTFDALPMEDWQAGEEVADVDYESLFGESASLTTVSDGPDASDGAGMTVEIAAQLNNLVSAMNTFSGNGAGEPGETMVPDSPSETLLTPLWETPSS